MKTCPNCFKTFSQENERHPFQVCSFACVKEWKEKNQIEFRKLEYRTMTQKGRGKSHLILVQEKTSQNRRTYK